MVCICSYQLIGTAKASLLWALVFLDCFPSRHKEFSSVSECTRHRSASHQVDISLGEERLQQSALMRRMLELSWETVRVGPVSERERTLCRPVLNGSVATPERLLFSEQLHLAALREAMIPPTPPYSPTKYQLDCSSCDLISRTEVCIEHLLLHKKKVKKKSKAAKSGRLSHNIMCVSEAVKTF